MNADYPSEGDRAVADASLILLDRLRSKASELIESRQIELSADEKLQVSLGMRRLINDLEHSLIDDLIEHGTVRRAEVSRAALEQRGIEMVLAGTEWLTGDEIGVRHNPDTKNKHAAASRWLAERKIFAIERAGQRLYPRYAFDALYNPLPGVASVIRELAQFSPFRMAGWFESTNGYLGGSRPRELIADEPDRVIAAAKDHRDGPMHG